MKKNQTITVNKQSESKYCQSCSKETKDLYPIPFKEKVTRSSKGKRLVTSIKILVCSECKKKFNKSF